jgi:hypothetical protein
MEHWKAVHAQVCKPEKDITYEPDFHADWPEQHMPARLYLHNTHLSIAPRADKNGVVQDLLMGKDEPTTYKLLIESFRVWDKTKRIGKGRMEDPRFSFGHGTARYNTGYHFKGMLMHIDMAEKKPGILPPWWSPEKREACIEVARTMYHWDDLDAGVPKETNEWCRYGGPDMRLALRLLGMKIEGHDMVTAVAMGYLNLHQSPNGNMILHSGTMESDFRLGGNISDHVTYNGVKLR